MEIQAGVVSCRASLSHLLLVIRIIQSRTLGVICSIRRKLALQHGGGPDLHPEELIFYALGGKSGLERRERGLVVDTLCKKI